jgi:lysosomal alpha-mannosidase
MRDSVKLLIKEGRFEFVNAGWSMHDEACTHYDDIMNNMMKGQQWLEKELGIKPTIGWHVDPFGHSNANPRLFAEMGLEAWIFARIDFQDKENRLDS